MAENWEDTDLNDENLGGEDLAGADLAGKELRSAYLRSANLTGANMAGAYMGDAYLRDADLTAADLTGAYMRGAYLGGAKIAGAKGIIRLSFSLPWDLILIRFPDGPRVLCGCHWFTVPEARAHWQAHNEQQRRDVVLPTLDALLAVAKAQGWEV